MERAKTVTRDGASEIRDSRWNERKCRYLFHEKIYHSFFDHCFIRTKSVEKIFLLPFEASFTFSTNENFSNRLESLQSEFGSPGKNQYLTKYCSVFKKQTTAGKPESRARMGWLQKVTKIDITKRISEQSERRD